MDAYVDVSRAEAVGVNGCTLSLRRTNESERVLELSLLSDWAWPHGLKLVAVVPAGTQHERWTVIVNGHASRWTGIQLGIGVNISDPIF